METLAQYLARIGTGDSSAAIYDALRDIFGEKDNPSYDQIRRAIASKLEVVNTQTFADKVIEFLIKNKDIFVKGSYIYPGESIKSSMSN